MDNDDINFPDVRTGTKNTPKYLELTEEESSPFYGYDYGHVFLFSMAYAFAHKLVPKAVSGEKNMPAKRFHAPERNMMRALAVEHTDDLNVIKDSLEYVKICEEYANAGFQEVYGIIKNNNFEKTKREDILLNIINNAVNEQD